MGPLTEGDDDGNTPLDADAIRGLMPVWVATRADLNEVEAENVASGYAWLRRTRPTIPVQLTVGFVSELHRRLFGDVWRWAGKYRTKDLNIGNDWHAITAAVKQLTDDFVYRLDETRRPTEAEAIDEACVDYHFRMVSIHPYLNGNGRHARASADALAAALGQPAFTWGSRSIVEPSKTRTDYIAALRAAERGDLAPITAFARS